MTQILAACPFIAPTPSFGAPLRALLRSLGIDSLESFVLLGRWSRVLGHVRDGS